MQRGVGRLLPEVLHARHRLEEVGGEGGGGREAGVEQHGVRGRVAAQRPPLLLHVRLREPLDVLQRLFLLLRVADHRDALAAQGRCLDVLLRVDEEADLVAADVGVLVEAREEGEPVHHHRDLARLEGVQAFLHVAVGVAGRRAAVVERLVELERLDGGLGVHEALHLVGLLGVLVLEAPGIEGGGHTHGDAFRAALGEDGGTVDLLAVDIAALEEFGHFLELGPGRRRGEVAAVLGLELGLQLGLGEPVLAVDPAQRVAHGRQRPVVGRALGPGRVGVDGGIEEIAHLDSFAIEEIVELDVVAVLGRAADPLAVADHQVAELALGVQLVEHAVGEVRPGHELELHLDAGLLGEALAQLDQRVRRVPRRPAQGQRLVLRARGSGRGKGQQAGTAGEQRRKHPHDCLPGSRNPRPRPPAIGSGRRV